MSALLIPPEFLDAWDQVLNRTGTFRGPVDQGVLWDHGRNLGQPDSVFPKCRPEEFSRMGPEQWGFLRHPPDNPDKPDKLMPVYDAFQYVSFADWEGPEPRDLARVRMFVSRNQILENHPETGGPRRWRLATQASFALEIKRYGVSGIWGLWGTGVQELLPKNAKWISRLRPMLRNHALEKSRWTRGVGRFPGSVYAPPGVYC